jgi:hypothetical protein
MTTEFVALYKLLKKFPGMQEEVGTTFGAYPGWGTTLGTSEGHFCTTWVEDSYFKPFVGEFFEKL